MAKVIQIRDVSDDVHDALVAQAEVRGLSLTKFLLGELEHLARRPEAAAHNERVIREVQKKIKSKVTNEDVVEAIRAGRGE